MTTTPALAPYPYFTDATGTALDGGYIYVGTSGLDPRTNPITVYQNAANTITWAQPMRTVSGYPAYQGAPSNFYPATVTYSIVVTSSKGAVLFTNLNVAPGGDGVNVVDYGASPSATAAVNVAAFQAALDTGRSVYIPGGTYSLNAKLTSTGKAVAITTDGAAILKWVTGSATQGLDFTFSNLTTQTLSIGDIELVTECEGGGSAIKATWPDGPTGYNRLMTFGRVMIRGADIPGQVGYWAEGIDTTNAWLAYGETLDFYGKASGVIALSNSAWVARGHTTEARCAIHARYAKAMLRLAGFSEGFDLSGSIAVACDWGVDCDPIMSGLNTPQIIWIGGHAACFKGGIRAVNLLQGNVSDILFYKRPDSAQNFIAFDLDAGSTEWQISNCKVFSLGNPGGGTTTAIKDAGVNNITSGLRTVGCNTDVNIVAGASGFSHTFSRSEGDRGLIVQGDTDGQVICLPGGSLGGTTSYFDVLTANSATPSILGYRKWGSCGHFLTASSVATTITDFTGGFPGDEFVLQANDANTTVQHSTGLQLNGAVNKVMASAETIRLRRVSSTAWKQI